MKAKSLNGKLPRPKARIAAIGAGVADSSTGQNSTPSGLYKPKKTKHASAHTSKALSGMGDYYGTSFRAKIGRIRGGYSPGKYPPTKKSLKTPPKSLV